MPSRWLS
jgi:hypothetical protein